MEDRKPQARTDDFEDNSKDRTPRAVAYSRVSTDKQRCSLDGQEQTCIERAHAKGWQVVECIRDIASGCSLDRPGIQQLRHMLSERSVDVIIAYSVDRLSRCQGQLDLLLSEAEQAGVQLEFVTEMQVERVTKGESVC